MGKSYENFMCKKFFHPTAKHNIKKEWMREQELQQESKEERDLLRSNTKELLYSKNFMLFKVLLCLVFIWTLIELFDAQNLMQSVVNVCVLMIISAVFSLKIAYKQFSNHKILFKAITKNTPIIVQSTLYQSHTK